MKKKPLIILLLSLCAAVSFSVATLSFAAYQKGVLLSYNSSALEIDAGYTKVRKVFQVQKNATDTYSVYMLYSFDSGKTWYDAQMTWTEGNIWEYDMVRDYGDEITYKYYRAKTADGSVDQAFEYGDNREVSFTSSGAQLDYFRYQVTLKCNYDTTYGYNLYVYGSFTANPWYYNQGHEVPYPKTGGCTEVFSGNLFYRYFEATAPGGTIRAKENESYRHNINLLTTTAANQYVVLDTWNGGDNWGPA